MADRLKEIHLERLKEMVSNFDKDERAVVLRCIPVEEMKAYIADKEASN